MELHQFQSRLSELLRQHASRLTELDIRQATAECRSGLYEDSVAHGVRIEEPFFNFISLDNVAVFTFFNSEFAVFVVPCREQVLIDKTGQFEMNDVAKCRRLLAQEYGKLEPDLVISRALAEYWLSQ
jgi:hypothetical protein